MSTTITCKIKPYIQPFERKLALAELCALTGGSPKPHNLHNGSFEFKATSKLSARFLANRLAYWEHISTIQNERFFTVQVLREATTKSNRNLENGQSSVSLQKNHELSLPNRRCLRYGPHGLHEYRGKYFPQLVRALINISGASARSVIADPMSGSGTTAVEAVLSGCQALGSDMNPLSVFMAKTKCAVLALNATELGDQVERMVAKLEIGKRRKSRTSLPYFRSLPEHDQDYLTDWFSPKVLQELDVIAQAIEEQVHPTIRDFFKLSLSNILRKISWQKEDDLRVRREIRDDDSLNPLDDFIKELRRSAVAMGSFLIELQGHKLGTHDIRQGDARRTGDFWKRFAGRVDAVITSPPYATALPYLDTDRLSLAYLGLLPRSQHRQHDLWMIGNREISDKIRQGYWEHFLSHKDQLPDAVSNLVMKIDRLNQSQSVGFRRRNLPALLTKYFFDMKDVLRGIKVLLRPGATAYIVVGNNHTIAGGQRVEIQTAELLAELATSVGLIQEESIPMEMLVSRDIFQKNATRTEAILVLRRPT